MGIGYNPRIVTNGLVLYLDAANRKSYPGSGTTLTDLSLRKLQATLANGASFSANSSGIITLDGTDDCIAIPKVSGIGTSTYSQTYCVWVKPNDTDGNIMMISADNGWNMPPLAAVSSTFRAKIWNNFYMYSDTYTIGSWYYLCLVFKYDPSQGLAYQRFYVNGFLKGEQTNIAYSSSEQDSYVNLGLFNPGSDDTGTFGCELGVVKIYTNRALTGEEIQQNFNALRGRYGI
jgi:hypothetical protein